MKALYHIHESVYTGSNKTFKDDAIIKTICIPLLAVGIPNLTGLISNHLYPSGELATHYLFFLGISFTVWMGNQQIMTMIYKNKHLQKDAYGKKLIILLTSVVMYSSLISKALLLIWFWLSKETSLNGVNKSTLLISICAIIIALLYDNYFLDKDQRDTIRRIEQLNLAKTHAELVALKNQIDPHFIFNSLNTLSYLISSKPKEAKLYNDTLGKVYQYILNNREKNLVSLNEEIEFMSNYFFLLKIRFENLINMIIEINDTEASNLLILPISLQILLENVMKHNELDEERPITIYVSVLSSSVIVKNEVNKKTYALPTSKVGLTNLGNRYKLLSGKDIDIQTTPEFFSVRLPLININWI